MSLYKILSLLLLSVMSIPVAAGEIKFRYPVDGQRIFNPVTRTFVFGQITPADMPFTINGQKVDVHTNGGFIAYLPVTPDNGSFAFNAELADGTTKQITIKLRSAADSEQKDPWLKINSVSSDLTVMPGDPVKIQANGTPGREAFFTIDGLVKDSPMTEWPEGSGKYTGIYWTKDSDDGKSGAVLVKFKTGFLRSSVQSLSKGRVRVTSAPSLLETTSDNSVIRNAIDGGYMLFLDRGVKLVSTGRAGNMHRIQLSPSETGWIDNAKVRLSESAVVPVPPFTETGNINLRGTKNGSEIYITAYDKVPYQVEETDFGLRLKMYYTNLHTNWIVYDSSDTFVKNVTFRQAAENIAEIDVFTSSPVWGYYVNYVGKALRLQLRRKPVVLEYWPKPLAGLNVVVDSGHSPRYSPPYDGTVGPLGTFEFQANLNIAKRLKARLENYGAKVIMTRSGDETVALADRPKIAREKGGDIFISVHNNALGDGQNPFNPPLGYQIYYYHQHSRALAAAIHGEYRKNIALPDQGLRFGDYLVTRQTWMPAVLTETAYLILPKQEEMLNDPEFQELAAKSMADGVLKFFNVQPEPPHTVYKKKGSSRVQGTTQQGKNGRVSARH